MRSIATRPRKPSPCYRYPAQDRPSEGWDCGMLEERAEQGGPLSPL